MTKVPISFLTPRNVEYSVGTAHTLFVRNLQREKDRFVGEMSPEFDLNNSAVSAVNNVVNACRVGRGGGREEKLDFYRRIPGLVAGK